MTDDTIQIRSATPDDFEVVTTYNIAMALETENKTLDPESAKSGAQAGLSDAARALYFIAEVDGKVAGQTMVTVEWSDWRNGFFWWIQSVYVDSSYRRRGVFRRLYDHIRDEAKNRGDVCGLRLYAHRGNNRAIDTYRKLGMIQTEYVMLEEEWSTRS